MGTLGGNPLPVTVVNGIAANPLGGAANLILLGSTKVFSYGDIRTGERQGSVTPVQLPNIAGDLVRVKAVPDNAGNVYLGWNAGVTVANGTTDTTTGYVLGPGDETPWLPIRNLNLLFMICDNAGDDVTYIVMVS